jgi:hemoglobin
VLNAPTRRITATLMISGKPPDMPVLYHSTPVFDEISLPAALRKEHRTKAGVWGVVRVIEGKLKLTLLDRPSETILTPDRPGLILPEQPHRVEPLGPMRMQVDFYDTPPTVRK